jgi:hypothetical protein
LDFYDTSLSYFCGYFYLYIGGTFIEMSLREKIVLAIEDHLQGNEEGIDGQEEAADDILKLIERRIDYIHEIKEEYNYEGHYHGDDEFWSGYELGFEKAFEIIKQEMLK